MNETIFYFFYSFAHQSAILDHVFVLIADTLPYVVIIIAGTFLLMHHEVFKAENPLQVILQKKKEILTVFFVSGTSWVVASLLKTLFHTPRPFIEFSDVLPLVSETGFAFPSGHATFFMALATSIYFLHKKAGYRFMIFALLIGIARIIVGVHFPVDILGGFALGALIAYLVKKV